MHEFAYFSIGGLPTKSGSTASAASQYSLRDLHVNIMLNPHAATQVRMSSYERQAGSNPKVRVVASLDRKRLGTKVSRKTSLTRGVFDEEASRKPLAFAADAVSCGI